MGFEHEFHGLFFTAEAVPRQGNAVAGIAGVNRSGGFWAPPRPNGRNQTDGDNERDTVQRRWRYAHNFGSHPCGGEDFRAEAMHPGVPMSGVVLPEVLQCRFRQALLGHAVSHAHGRWDGPQGLQR